MLKQETEKPQVRSLNQEDPLEKGMATHSSILAWRIPRIEEPGQLQSMIARVRHNRVCTQCSLNYQTNWNMRNDDFDLS